MSETSTGEKIVTGGLIVAGGALAACGVYEIASGTSGIFNASAGNFSVESFATGMTVGFCASLGSWSGIALADKIFKGGDVPPFIPMATFALAGALLAAVGGYNLAEKFILPLETPKEKAAQVLRLDTTNANYVHKLTI